MWLQCTCRWEWSEGRQRKVKDGHWEKQENEKQSRWASLDHVLTMAGGGASRVFGSLMPTCRIFHRLKVSDQGFWLLKKKIVVSYNNIQAMLCWIPPMFPCFACKLHEILMETLSGVALGETGRRGLSDLPKIRETTRATCTFFRGKALLLLLLLSHFSRVRLCVTP